MTGHCRLENFRPRFGEGGGNVHLLFCFYHFAV
jgi:hypothetical protein